MNYPEIKQNLGKTVKFNGKEYVLLGKRVLKANPDNPFVDARFELILFNREKQSALFAPMEEVEPCVKIFGYRSAIDNANDFAQENI